MSRREEEKKRRRQKRLEKRQRQETKDQALDDLARVLQSIRVSPPAHWPGASDQSLDRPDLVKFDLAEAAAGKEPGASKLKQLKDRFLKGPLGSLPGMDHWAIEEFLYHGVAGDSWHPIEDFLAWREDRFPPPAREQLRRWKEARVGIFEVIEIQEATATVQEWDPAAATAIGPPLRVISLGIGGVNAYRKIIGHVLLTYVAPWAPAEDLYCCMGYGVPINKRKAAILLPYLGLSYPELVARPWPWKTDRESAEAFLREWQRREWYAWLRERLRFPFEALVALPPVGEPARKLVKELVPTTARDARQFGIYFEVPHGKECIVAGATNVTPLEITSPNLAPLAEYHAYRQLAGPPPGTVGNPQFLTLK